MGLCDRVALKVNAKLRLLHFLWNHAGWRAHFLRFFWLRGFLWFFWFFLLFENDCFFGGIGGLRRQSFKRRTWKLQKVRLKGAALSDAIVVMKQDAAGFMAPRLLEEWRLETRENSRGVPCKWGFFKLGLRVESTIGADGPREPLFSLLMKDVLDAVF